MPRRARPILIRLLLSLLFGVLTTIAVAWACAVAIPSTNLTATLHQHLCLSDGSATSMSTTVWSFSRPGMRRREFTWFPILSSDDPRFFSGSYGHGPLGREFDTASRITSYAAALVPPPPLSNPSSNSAGTPSIYLGLSGKLGPSSATLFTPVYVPAPLPTLDGLAANPTSDVYAWEDARGWPCLAMWSWQDLAAISARSWPTVHDGLAVRPDSVANWFDVRVVPFRVLWRGFLADTAIYAVAWAVLLIVPRAWRHRRRAHANHCLACGYHLRDSTTCPECGHTQPKAAA